MRYQFTPEQAKEMLDEVIRKAKSDVYKPIQVAETLRKMSEDGTINPHDLRTYSNPSKKWRDQVTKRLMGKVSTSNSRYQDDVWNAIGAPILEVLKEQNVTTGGAVERYIYLGYEERQSMIAAMASSIQMAAKDTLDVAKLFELFRKKSGVRKSADKAFEVFAYALFKAVVESVELKVEVSISTGKERLVEQFGDLVEILTGLKPRERTRQFDANLFRGGLTNSADSGIDMWANFGPSVQVKHVSLRTPAVEKISRESDSDQIVIVCSSTDRKTIEAVVSRIGALSKVRGIVTEDDLVRHYETALRGEFSGLVGERLLDLLKQGFREAFPQTTELTGFLAERNYAMIVPPELWRTDLDRAGG